MDLQCLSADVLDMGPVLCLLSAACFGAMAIFGKLAYAAGISPEALLVVRFGVAAGLLAMLLLLRPGLRRDPAGPGRRTDPARVTLCLLVTALGLGAIGYAPRHPRVAAGVLFNDGLGGILLVRPTYKPFWDLPGGYVEVGESPRQAAVREVKEELGIDVDANALLSVDRTHHKDEGDKLLFIFDGGLLSPERVRSMRFQDGEVGEARFVVE
jgi:ADP-ribose pyrophosphatase YjhB (NUDIX family)